VIPAAVCLVAVVLVVLGSRLWQGGIGSAQAQPMDLRGQWLGMQLASTGSQTAADLGVPAEVKGVVVADVQVSSRAQLAGLAAGDVVARIDGTVIGNVLDVYTLSTKVDIARPMQVDFLRAGRPVTVIVAPLGGGAMPANAAPAMEGVGWTGPVQVNPACPNCTTPR
jgi:S1-C subfamily serine protease